MTQITKHRPGRMLAPEEELKKRLFAEMLLEPDRYSRDQICDKLGITANTYYKWSKDPKLASLAGFDSERYDLSTRIAAAKLKRKALQTLERIMDNGIDLAAVRAAEIIMGMDTTVQEEDTVANKKAAETLLKTIQPVFVVSSPETLKSVVDAMSQRPAHSEPEDNEDDDAIDADYYEVVDE